MRDVSLHEMRPPIEEVASRDSLESASSSSPVIRWSTRALPREATLKNELQIPMGVVITPLDPTASCATIARLKSPERIARCSSCYGYVNGHCRVDASGFACCMCGTYTVWQDAAKGSRYSKGLATTQKLPELQAETYEFDMAVEAISSTVSGEKGGNEVEEVLDENDWRRRAVRNDSLELRPGNGRAIVAIVDLNDAGEEYCELVKLALGSAIEALDGEDVRFGVFTFRGDTLEAIDFSGDRNNDVVSLKYFDSHANPKKHGFIRRVQDVTTSVKDVLSSPSSPTTASGWKEVVTSAIEAHVGTPEDSTEPNDSSSSGFGRIFGPVLDEVLNVIDQAVDEGLVSSARVISFLRGGPSRGVGSCSVDRLTQSVSDVLLHDAVQPTAEDFEMASREADELMIPSHDHYESIGERCLLHGVEVDVILTSDDFNDLSTLAPLAERSGGNVLTYPNKREIPIVGDVHRLLRNEKAINATLRVRTTADLEIANAYGALHPDRAYVGLYHIASCAMKDAFTFDFDYSTSAGLEEELNSRHPKVQLAFEYTCIERQVVETGDIIVRRRRRRRIHTCRANIARSARDVYKHVDVNAMMCLITRQVLATSEDEGLTEARQALVDWFIAFSAAAEATNNAFSFVKETIPRLVYGLLRSNVLHPIGPHPDRRVAAVSQLTRLDPDETATFVYPQLFEFFATEGDDERTSDVLQRRSSLLPLRREMVYEQKDSKSASPRVFVAHCADEVIVVHTGGAPWSTYPPRHGSALDIEIRQIRESCTFLPRLTHVRIGLDNPEPLDSRLVEHLESEVSFGRGFDGFIDFCRTQGAKAT